MTDVIDQPDPIALIGGLGKTGRRVAALLAAQGRSVRPLSRSAAFPFDWDAPQGWAAALAGTGAAYVTFQPDLSVPHAVEAIERLSGVAMAQGVRQIVLLSGRGEEGARRAEEALAASGIDWTVVRASWFMQNFSESFLCDAVRAGELVIPLGTAPEPFVDADDIAEVAIAALLRTIPGRRVYEVTGPQAVRFSDAFAAIGDALGRRLTCREVDIDAFADHLSGNGLPAPLIPVLIDLFTTTLDGRNTDIASGIAEALGRPPRSLPDYARNAARTGAWPRDAHLAVAG